MPNPPTRRPGKHPIQAAPTTSADVPAAREPRGARRKRETRARLLEAALRLMAEKGMEGAAINEITEAADVGFGSFYNHFESKEAIYAALTDWVFEDFADEVDRAIGGLSDPAQVMSVSVRHTLLRARREPIWGEFLIRESFAARNLNRGLGPRLLRDIRRGIAAKRFVIADPLMSFISAGGMILTAIAVELRFAIAGGLQASALRDFGFSGENVPERTAAILLQLMGLPRSEAEEIAHRPLPGVVLPNQGI
ncbi:TetR/AcrR family transcriptional regulator [Paraburkholderia sp. BL9I2N2]|uniref:TetR/AcrR family transcriptional regulator n=1 Tax=Paraburkholderia sp. BL9I2N2 TaxID=1938809 RepID=UPI00104BB305|nr:TetR/AcrR family transcriptional regulator [Paraburkholderia sp. BL9I2N2]TCK84031.1 TetR family transcriptional regulator [Paraburkholderia sp. BL9I2N2]